MDYVLFGMGYGASLMLLGWALRTFGPQFKYNQPPKEDDAEYQVEKRFWIRFIQGLGGVIAISGTAMVLMTFVVVLVNPSDATGRNIALVLSAVVLIGVLVWCWFYKSSYGLAGVWSRQGGYGFRQQTSTASLTRMASSISSSRGLTSSKKLDPVEAPTVESSTVESETIESAITEPTVEPNDSADEVVTDSPPDIESGPVYDFGDGTETTVPSESSGRAEALRRMRERQAKLRQSTNQ